MVKINLTAENLSNCDVFLAMTELISLLSNKTMHTKILSRSAQSSQVHADLPSHSPRANSFHQKKKAVHELRLNSEEVEDWISILEPKQKEFVTTLRSRGSLTLSEVAEILGVKPSVHDMKKKVNGLVGSIIRWSKVRYLNESRYLPEGVAHYEVKLFPPWYCRDSVYYWGAESL